MEGTAGFQSPEEAALGSWPPGAKARVLEGSQHRDDAVVLIDTEPSHPVRVYGEPEGGLWTAVSDSTY